MVEPQFDGLVQKICNSSALAMELRLSCTKPSKYNQDLLIFILYIWCDDDMVWSYLTVIGASIGESPNAWVAPLNDLNT